MAQDVALTATPLLIKDLESSLTAQIEIVGVVVEVDLTHHFVLVTGQATSTVTWARSTEFELGQLVRATGRLTEFRGRRQLHTSTLRRIHDANEETRHLQRVLAPESSMEQQQQQVYLTADQLRRQIAERIEAQARSSPSVTVRFADLRSDVAVAALVTRLQQEHTEPGTSKAILARVVSKMVSDGRLWHYDKSPQIDAYMLVTPQTLVSVIAAVLKGDGLPLPRRMSSQDLNMLLRRRNIRNVPPIVLEEATQRLVAEAIIQP
ncbi:hypothetical protein RI367_002353 [Sorochytrium milnesiophthora]